MTRPVPPTFTRSSSASSRVGVSAHARWTTTSQPRAASVSTGRLAASPRSAWTHVTGDQGSTEVSGRRRETPTTSSTSLSASRARVRAEPTLPLGPVTRIRTPPR
jgi:hypothetical protein